MIFVRKNTKIPEFYLTFARKCPNFFMTFARKISFPIFYLGGGHVTQSPRLLRILQTWSTIRQVETA